MSKCTTHVQKVVQHPKNLFLSLRPAITTECHNIPLDTYGMLKIAFCREHSIVLLKMVLELSIHNNECIFRMLHNFLDTLVDKMMASVFNRVKNIR